MTLREAPYDYDGNLMNQATRWEIQKGHVVMRPNGPFEATLTLDGYSVSRSSSILEWKDESGRKFPMYLSDGIEVLRRASGGIVTGTWIVKKKGTSYGLALAQ